MFPESVCVGRESAEYPAVEIVVQLSPHSVISPPISGPSSGLPLSTQIDS